jgi:uncharacterized protein
VRAVANAGPLIHLSWIGQLHLLNNLFAEVLAPVAVRDEVLGAGRDLPGVTAIRDAFAVGWITVRPVANLTAVMALTGELDRGESEAIVLMREAEADVLLLDERRARAHATRERLPITGTIGILRMARDHRIIAAVAPLLEELKQRGFRVGAELIEQIQREEATEGQG